MLTMRAGEVELSARVSGEQQVEWTAPAEQDYERLASTAEAVICLVGNRFLLARLVKC
jgi:hypothetical protein